MKKVDAQVNFPELEEAMLQYWQKEKIFEKTLEKEAPNGEFVFYDGPPFATGLPHYGHFIPGLLKDIFPRYKTMQGYHVERKWGWDCHGLPIENIVEKELGFKSKKEIEKYGIGKFNELCRTKVLSYANDWEKIMKRFGRFVDMKDAYRTMDADYMESIWWAWKTLWEKGLVYESYRTMHICPRCETTLSQQEVSEGYMDVKDLAVTAKFALKDEPGTYILAWTTTPWTLPGNVALAVGKDIEYVKVKSEDAFYIVAKDLAEKVFAGKEYSLEKEFLGSELIGATYTPPFTDYFQNTNLENHENGWKIYHADFVTTEIGTGIAHEAPAFGEDDMALGKLQNLPWVQHVAMDGTMKPEVTQFAGMQVKPIDDRMAFDVEIIKALATKNLLFSKEKYEHSYPHCWRCDTPLLNYATNSWFIAVEKIKSTAIENAKDIVWSPEHIKNGRFGKWLEGARDWSVSRQRFWASCIPLWVCVCGEKTVIGSRQELFERSGVMVDDLHKHIVDEVTFPCEKCAQSMTRIPDVLDTWFDSGSMPYASKHYMGEGELAAFPANFIAEGLDQTRAWFYYLHVLGTALEGKNAFKSCVVNGTVLAEDGKKMSKKLNNYPDPSLTIEKHGADALRLYLATSPVVNAENLSFSERDLESITRNTFRMLWNSYSFFTTYAVLDNWSPQENKTPSENILDRWILAELQGLIQNMTEELEKYQPAAAARLVMPFVDNMSNWYIRRSRKRFWKSEDDNDKDDAYHTLYNVLIELSKLMAPFTPFIADEIYRNLTLPNSDEIGGGQAGKEPARNDSQEHRSDSGGSVHLEKWPETQGVIDTELIEKMQLTRELITKGLQLRTEAKIKVRQPLGSVAGPEMEEVLQDIVKEELNVREYLSREGNDIELNIEITPELKLEGEAREIIRALQEGRKKAGFNVEDRITLGYSGKENVFIAHEKEISAEILAEGGVQKGELENSEYTETVEIEGEQFTFWLKRS